MRERIRNKRLANESRSMACRAAKMMGTLRVCHDCGKPTTDYRCRECREVWRLKHGVIKTRDWDNDEDTA